LLSLKNFPNFFVTQFRSFETQSNLKSSYFGTFRDQFNTIKEIRNEIQQIKEKDERKPIHGNVGEIKSFKN